MSEADSAEPKKSYPRRPLVKKLNLFILGLIDFSSNEKTKAIVKFTSLSSVPLIIGNHIPLEFACILFYSLLIVVSLEIKEDMTFSRIAQKTMEYRYADCDEVYNGGTKWFLSTCLVMVYFVCFIWNFSFKEAIIFLAALPTGIYYGLGFLIVMSDLIFDTGSPIYCREIAIMYKIEEIHLKNIYRQVALKSSLYSNNRSGYIIKNYIEEELSKHDSDGYEKAMAGTP